MICPMSNPVICLYGIPHCDTVKKARAWLDSQGVDHVFHDFKKAGLPDGPLDEWLEAVGGGRLLNRKGTSWRALDEPIRAGVTDNASARDVMRAQASTIKRPVVDWGPGVEPRVSVGFSEPDFARAVEQVRQRQ